MSDNKLYIEWQRMTTSNNEYQQVVQQVIKSDNKYTTSDNMWQQRRMSDSEWQQWYNHWKQYSTLQRMELLPSFQLQKQTH